MSVGRMIAPRLFNPDFRGLMDAVVFGCLADGDSFFFDPLEDLLLEIRSDAMILFHMIPAYIGF